MEHRNTHLSGRAAAERGTARGSKWYFRRGSSGGGGASHSEVQMATETWGTGMGHGASVLGMRRDSRGFVDKKQKQQHQQQIPPRRWTLSDGTDESQATTSTILTHQAATMDTAQFARASHSTGDAYPPQPSLSSTTHDLSHENTILSHIHASSDGTREAEDDYDVEEAGGAQGDAARTKANMSKHRKTLSNTSLRQRLQQRTNHHRRPQSERDHHEATGGPHMDWFSPARYRWDTIKTATPARRFALACMAEFLGAWIYSFVLWGTVYNLLAETYASIQTSLMGLFYFLGTTVGVYLTLLVASPVAGGHYVPSVTVVSTLVGLFPMWKALFYIVAQCVGYWMGQLMAAATVWSWIVDLRDFLLEESGGDTAVFFKNATTARTPLAGFFIYFKPGMRTWGSVVFAEVFLNFLLGLVICASFDISNPYVSPSNSIWPIALTAGVFFGFFNPPSQSLNPARWMSGFTCWIIFDDRKRCFPAKETFFVILTPILGLLLAYIWYAAFISDSRRPAASQMLSEVDDIVRQRAEQARGKQADWMAKHAANKEAQQDFKRLNHPLLPSDTVDIVQTTDGENRHRSHESPRPGSGGRTGSAFGQTMPLHTRNTSTSSMPMSRRKPQDLSLDPHSAPAPEDPHVGAPPMGVSGDPLSPPPQVYASPGK